MPDSPGPQPDNGSNVPDNASNVPDNVSNVPDNYMKKKRQRQRRKNKGKKDTQDTNTVNIGDQQKTQADNPGPQPDNGSNVPDNGSNVPDNGSNVPDNGSNVPDNGSNVPDNNMKKKRQRQRRKNTGKKDTQDTNTVNIGDQQKTQASGDHVSNSAKVDQRKKNRKRPRARRFDRYYGRFRCRICRRTWDSAHVFTVAGTKKVLWKQRCANCNSDDAWMNPIGLELLRCSVCHSEVCECKCDECNKLKHRRYVYTKIQEPDGEVEKRTVDKSFEYCDCSENRRRFKGQVGANSDLKKPHLAHLCQKCMQGFLCAGVRSADSDDPDEECPEDNEP